MGRSLLRLFLAAFALFGDAANAGGSFDSSSSPSSTAGGYGSPSTAFLTGIILGRNFDVMNKENKDESCLDKLSSHLQDEVQSVGFRFDTQLLNQIINGEVRQKICSKYNKPERKAELDECHRTEPGSKSSVSGIFALLKVICEGGQNVLERTSDCLKDMEENLHKNCVNACQRQADLKILENGVEMDDRDNQLVCRIGACVVQCMSAQVQECDEVESTELKDFYGRISGTQMLLGVESANAFGSSLLKANKLPAKCQQIIQRSTRTLTKTAMEHSGKFKQQMFIE